MLHGHVLLTMVYLLVISLPVGLMHSPHQSIEANSDSSDRWHGLQAWHTHLEARGVWRCGESVQDKQLMDQPVGRRSVPGDLPARDQPGAAADGVGRRRARGAGAPRVVPGAHGAAAARGA